MKCVYIRLYLGALWLTLARPLHKVNLTGVQRKLSKSVKAVTSFHCFRRLVQMEIPVLCALSSTSRMMSCVF